MSNGPSRVLVVVHESLTTHSEPEYVLGGGRGRSGGSMRVDDWDTDFTLHSMSRHLPTLHDSSQILYELFVGDDVRVRLRST